MNYYRNCRNVWVDYKIKQGILNATPYAKINDIPLLIHLAIDNPNSNIVFERALSSLPEKLIEEIMSQTGRDGVIRIMKANSIKPEINKKIFLITHMI